jgi:hypothetical protein
MKKWMTHKYLRKKLMITIFDLKFKIAMKMLNRHKKKSNKKKMINHDSIKFFYNEYMY